MWRRVITKRYYLLWWTQMVVAEHLTTVWQYSHYAWSRVATNMAVKRLLTCHTHGAMIVLMQSPGFTTTTKTMGFASLKFVFLLRFSLDSTGFQTTSHHNIVWWNVFMSYFYLGIGHNFNRHIMVVHVVINYEARTMRTIVKTIYRKGLILQVLRSNFRRYDEFVWSYTFYETQSYI